MPVPLLLHQDRGTSRREAGSGRPAPARGRVQRRSTGADGRGRAALTAAPGMAVGPGGRRSHGPGAAQHGRALGKHDGNGLGRTIAATAAVAGIAGVDVYAAVTRSRRPRRAAAPLAGPSGGTRWSPATCRGRIAWRSLDGSVVSSEGEVRFTQAPARQDTEVRVRLRYSMPAGRLGEAVARYFGEDPHSSPTATRAGSSRCWRLAGRSAPRAPGGKRARREFPQHPARPLSGRELAEARS